MSEQDTTLKEDGISTESTWSETKSELADTEGDSDGTDSGDGGGGGSDSDDSDSDSDDSDA